MARSIATFFAIGFFERVAENTHKMSAIVRNNNTIDKATLISTAKYDYDLDYKVIVSPFQRYFIYTGVTIC